METSIGNLRSRLRGMVAARNGEMTRLAVVDAIMDRALLPKERALLGAIPKLLQPHFERLRKVEEAALQAQADAQAAQADGAPDGEAPDAGASDAGASAKNGTPASADAGAQAASTAPAITPGAWLDTFRADMRSVLLAELDVRLQPVEGLLAALRTS